MTRSFHEEGTMPRDLFGDVVRPARGIGSRKWYTLPLSLLLHTVVLTVVIVVPLMATGVLPMPTRGAIEWTEIMPAVPAAIPVAPQPRAATTPTLADVNPNIAPIDAPDGVQEETGLVPAEPTSAGVEGGLPVALEGGGAASLAVIEPPPPPAVPAPIKVSSGIRPPTKVRDVSPVYPEIAQRARVEGIVILEATIGIDGRVTNARVLRSIPLLDQPALDAVRQWTFTPTLLNGTPVSVIMTVTVTFALK
jgi:periplasmic protein TonB